MFVGMKMLIVEWVKIPIGAALGIVVAILATAILASIHAARREAVREEVAGSGPPDNPVGAADPNGADDELQNCP
jgi:hypothetical protein